MKINGFFFVLVLYKVKLEESESFKDITFSLCQIRPKNPISILIYDNSPDFQNITNENVGLWDIQYIHDPENSGLGKAYNIAAEVANKKEKKWLVLLDQDTHFPGDILEKYIKAINNNSNINMFAPILKAQDNKITSPYTNAFLRKKNVSVINSGIHSLQETGPINSGLCIKVDAYLKSGGYNEKIKLDGTDFQFVNRFRKIYHFYYIVDVIGSQNLSNFETNIDIITTRYINFLRDAKHFENHRPIDSLETFIMVVSRTIKIIYITRNMLFIKLFFKKYILSK